MAYVRHGVLYRGRLALSHDASGHVMRWLDVVGIIAMMIGLVVSMLIAWWAAVYLVFGVIYGF